MRELRHYLTADYSIKCQNTYDKNNLRRSGTKLLTSKDNRDYHGYRIQVMKRIAEKYNGMLTTEEESNLFNVLINICLTSKVNN